MNKRLTTDMADANGLQRAVRPTGFFNIKKMAGRFLQRAMHNGQYWVFKNWEPENPYIQSGATHLYRYTYTYELLPLFPWPRPLVGDRLQEN